MENNPQINLTVGSQEFQLRRDNTELYHYLAFTAFTHIFIQDSEDDELRRGTFIPREYIGHEPFDMIASAMLEHDYVCHLNLREVSDSDAEIITKILAGKDVEDYPDWL